MVYDPGDLRIVLFGGYLSDTYDGETWEVRYVLS